MDCGFFRVASFTYSTPAGVPLVGLAAGLEHNRGFRFPLGRVRFGAVTNEELAHATVEAWYIQNPEGRPAGWTPSSVSLKGVCWRNSLFPGRGRSFC